MKTVYKYPVSSEDIFYVDMPYDAEILSVQEQRGEVFMWCLVDTKHFLNNRVFRLVGTGHPMDEKDDYKFIGTFQLHGGSLVFHLFEVIS